MFTIRYKGFFIHGFFSKKLCRVQKPDGILLGVFVSMRTAKEAVRRVRIA